MSPLRSKKLLLAIALAGAAAPALAAQITCESQGPQAQACGTVQPGSEVHLVQQLSHSPCIRGRTWSADNDSLWVSGGCRAVFEVIPPDARVAQRPDRYQDGEDQSRDTRQPRDSGEARGTDEARDARDAADVREQRQYASNDDERERARAHARHACVREATQGHSFTREEVRTNEVQWIGQGLFSVNLDTPEGPLNCTVDRDGNVRSLR